MTDNPLNPSDIVVNGESLSDANPLPVSFQPSAGTAVVLNPRSIMVEGIDADTDHPLSVSFG